jgi:hypothetical protein
MKKFYFFAVLFFILVVSVSAYDTIVLVNGNMIEAKVEEITPTEVKYRRTDNLNGPLITINKSDVYSIKFDNGTVEVIKPTIVVGQQAPKPTSPEFDPTKLYFSLSFEPAGFLAGGPSATGEFTKGATISSFHFSFPTLALNNPSPGFGFGLGGTINHLWSSRIGGLYIGGSFEWNAYPYLATVSNPYGKYNPSTDTYSKTNITEEVTAHNFIIALNGGYRFVTNSGMYFRTGVTLGMTLSNYVPLGFYFKPDISTGYIFGGSAAARTGNAAATAAAKEPTITGGFKVILSKLSTLDIESGSNAETALKGNYSRLSGVRNRAPLTKALGDVLIFLPEDALPINIFKYTRLTITAKYYDASGKEIPQGDSQVMVSLINFLNSDIRGPANGPGTNTPIKEFNVGGPSGTISKNNGVKINFRSPPQAVLFQNVNPSIAFIEMTNMVFHNKDYTE